MSRKPKAARTSKGKKPVSRIRKATPANRRRTGVGRGGTVALPPGIPFQTTGQNSGETAAGRFAKGNPYRFKPGRSGNPGGRAKNKLLNQAYRELLEQVDPKTGKTVAQLIAEGIVKKALKGDLAAVKEITDRTEGKAVQPLSHSGLGSEPIAFNVFLGRKSGK